jgi:hypothetical protein
VAPWAISQWLDCTGVGRDSGPNEAVHHQMVFWVLLLSGVPTLRAVLTWFRLQGEVDQLTWQSHPDSVTPLTRKVSPQSGPIPLGGRGVWSTPRNLWEEFHSSRTFSKGGKDNNVIITSVWMNEQPDSSLIQARVCGSVT